jgi:hypothetical protein
MLLKSSSSPDLLKQSNCVALLSLRHGTDSSISDEEQRIHLRKTPDTPTVEPVVRQLQLLNKGTDRQAVKFTIFYIGLRSR